MRSTILRAVPASLVLVLLLGVAHAQAASFVSPFLGGARTDVNANGQAIVAWTGPSGVRVVTGDRAGGFGAPVALSATPDATGPPQAAIDDAGDAIVVWETSRQLPGSGCSTCGPRTLSTGVWAALRPAGGFFARPIELAGPRADGGADSDLAGPLLAMSATGHAVVAWSDRDGIVAVLRTPGGAFGPPQRFAPQGFEANSAAIAGSGEAFVGDRSGDVAIRPAGGSFGSLQGLPDAPAASPTGYPPYSTVFVAANTRGDALAAYAGSHGLEVTRRTAGGDWGSPSVLSATGVGGQRAAALSETGEGVVTYAQVSAPDSYDNRRTLLLAALIPAAGQPTSELVGAPDLDADTAFDGSGLDVDAAGDVAVGFERTDHKTLFGRAVAQLGLRRGAGPFAAPATLTPADAIEHAFTDTADVAFGADGELLVTWADHYLRQTRLNARWITPGSAGTPFVIDTAATTEFVLPNGSLAPTRSARLVMPPRVIASRHGRIPIRLSCISSDGTSCKVSVTCAAGPTRWRAARGSFTARAGHSKLTYVTLTSRARSVLRRRGHVTLTATAVTSNARPAKQRDRRTFVVRRA